MTDYTASGPYIVWEDYGCEGWKPRSYATLQEAVTAEQIDERHVLTKAVVFEVSESQTRAPEARTSYWWESPSEREHRTAELIKPIIPSGALIMADQWGGVQVSDTISGYGFAVTGNEFMDGLHTRVVPERARDLMRQRIADGTVAADKPTM